MEKNNIDTSAPKVSLLEALGIEGTLVRGVPINAWLSIVTTIVCGLVVASIINSGIAPPGQRCNASSLGFAAIAAGGIAYIAAPTTLLALGCASWSDALENGTLRVCET